MQKIMQTYQQEKPWRKRIQTFYVVAGCLLLVGTIGLFDYLTGQEIKIYPLYLIPIVLAAWLTNLRISVVISFMAVAAWFISNYMAGLRYSKTYIYFINGMAHLSSFILVVVLISFLRKSREAERNFARVDLTTLLPNIRAFYEAAAHEIARQKRGSGPLTVAYIDLDNFKVVNDRFGHKTGNTLLVRLGDTLKKGTRSTDLAARLGGDEFIMLLPDTDSDSARIYLERIKSAILKMMARNSWPVTCSIGAVTFMEPPRNVDDLIGYADACMYKVKNAGKNDIKLEQFPAL